MAVDLAPLPQAAEISFPDMLGGEDIDAEWEKASGSIQEIFQDAPGSHALGHEGRRALYSMVRYYRPLSILEIGANAGASTLSIAMAMNRYRSTSLPPRLVTIDLFDVNNPSESQAKWYRLSAPPRAMLARLDCADLVEFVTASSLDYLPGRAAVFDFIFVDHSASADIVYREIPLALAALRAGGHLLMNSYYPDGKPLCPGGAASPGPYLAVRRLRREGAGLVALPLGALPRPPGRGGSNHLTSLALLARE